MENKLENIKLTRVIGFVKEEDGNWYADLPEYLEKGIGNKNDLLMIDGADTFLDFISDGGIRAELLISTEEFGGYDTVIQKESIGKNDSLIQQAGHGVVEYGAYYTVDTYKGAAYTHRLWLCPVTEYVFGGYYPEKVYIKLLDVKSNKTRKTIYHLIIDNSGSMSDCIESTISGVNEQIQNIRNLQKKYPEEEITIGVTTFNDTVTHHFFLSNPENIKPFTTEDYRPDGYTALLDAIGLTVEKIQTVFQDAETRIPTTVVIVILTDGEENRSQLYSLKTIKNKISGLEKTEKWTFSFLGADIDVVKMVGDMSINRKNSFSFAKANMKQSLWGKLSSSMDNYVDRKSKNIKDKSLFED